MHSTILNKADNLCDYCKESFAVCISNVKFGKGVGNDNVIECNSFNSKEESFGEGIVIQVE